MERTPESQEIIKLLRSIKNWVSFFGIITVFSLVVWIGFTFIAINEKNQQENQQQIENRLNNLKIK